MTLQLGSTPLTIEQTLAVARGQLAIAPSSDAEFRRRLDAGVSAVEAHLKAGHTI